MMSGSQQWGIFNNLILRRLHVEHASCLGRPAPVVEADFCKRDEFVVGETAFIVELLAIDSLGASVCPELVCD